MIELEPEPYVVDITPIIRQSHRDTTTLFGRLIKAQEELGELSAEILAHQESKNKSASARGTTIAVAEEAVDTLICIVDILTNIGVRPSEIAELIKVKSQKWAAKHT